MPERGDRARPVRILHAHSTFSLGGKEARAVRLMNAWGERAHHTILSATDQFGARDAIAPGITADFPADAPPLAGKPGPRRYRALARYMARFDLVLTYNWGAMDMVAARRLFARHVALPPLIHHEDGFNADEAKRLKPVRNGFRWLMLPAAYRLVVPSQRLEVIARDIWRRPSASVVRIGNGIPVERFAGPPVAGAIPGFERRPGEVVVGTVAGLRAVKNLPRLVRAFTLAELPNARLVIVGEGPERGAIEHEVIARGVEGRVIMPGFLADPARWIGHFDIFALSSDSEQFPISLLEAMAAGLPVVATAVGDVPDMVAEENRFAIGGQPPGGADGDQHALTKALVRFAADPDLRRTVGAANRVKAQTQYDERAMIARYARLYGEAIGDVRAFASPP